MNRSRELEDLMKQFYEEVSEGDAGFMIGHISKEDGVLLIGTDPSEYWTDTDSMIPTLTAQHQARIEVRHGDIQAFSEGSVGWVGDRGAFLLPNGNKVSFRWTGVFHQEDRRWKLVQGHISIGVPNRDALDTDLV